MQPIDLSAGWRYFPTEVMDPAFGTSALDESSWGLLDRLSAYPRDVLSFYKEMHLQRTFGLDPILDVCLRYQLHIPSAPGGTAVYVNGWHVGNVDAGKSFSTDVTDYVMLEDNLILLKLSRKGDFETLLLQPVPCA